MTLDLTAWQSLSIDQLELWGSGREDTIVLAPQFHVSIRAPPQVPVKRSVHAAAANRSKDNNPNEDEIAFERLSSSAAASKIIQLASW
jgi:hypothetical protein